MGQSIQETSSRVWRDGQRVGESHDCRHNWQTVTYLLLWRCSQCRKVKPLGSDKALRHEVVSVIVVRDRTSRHNPLSHQRYPTKMCRKATICTAPSDNV